MNKTLTEQLTDHILNIEYAQLPEQAIEMAKQVALDGFAVMLAGATEPLGVGRISIEYTREMGGHPQSTVIAGGFKTSMQNAAYVNGTMAHALDYDNTWYPLNHPTSPTLPAILAIAEHYQLDGKAIIEAIVTAFEVQGRLRLAATGMTTGSGFHKPGMTGTFGAVAAAIKLLKLDSTQALMALGIAGSRAGSISINTGSMTKSSHSGHAARMGVECGILASKGWTASADVFGSKGFFDTFMGDNQKPHLLVENFANPLRMIDPGVGFKKHPSNYFTHRPIDGALALRQAHQITLQNIEQVEIIFPRFEYVNRQFPKTGLDGKFSVQYTTLIALLDGEITIDSFNNERRYASDVSALLPHVHLIFDDAIPTDFDAMHCAVTVTLKNGEKHSQKIDKLSGWIGSPLSRDQRIKKFNLCAHRVLSQSNANQMISYIERLDTLDNINDLMALARN
jgi:aconitate decarboxylase